MKKVMRNFLSLVLILYAFRIVLIRFCLLFLVLLNARHHANRAITNPHDNKPTRNNKQTHTHTRSVTFFMCSHFLGKFVMFFRNSFKGVFILTFSRNAESHRSMSPLMVPKLPDLLDGAVIKKIFDQTFC